MITYHVFDNIIKLLDTVLIYLLFNMPVRLKSLREIEEEITEAVRHELGEAEGNAKSESGDEEETDSEASAKQAMLSKRIKRFMIRFLKGFGSGLGVYAGIKVFAALMRNPFRERFVFEQDVSLWVFIQSMHHSIISIIAC